LWPILFFFILSMILVSIQKQTTTTISSYIVDVKFLF